jgi:uncharacterized membrane protein YhiD involved in acid resistance
MATALVGVLAVSGALSAAGTAATLAITTAAMVADQIIQSQMQSDTQAAAPSIEQKPQVLDKTQAQLAQKPSEVKLGKSKKKKVGKDALKAKVDVDKPLSLDVPDTGVTTDKPTATGVQL